MPDAPGLGVDIDEEFVAQFPSEGNVSIPIVGSLRLLCEGTFGARLCADAAEAGRLFPK